MYLSNTSSSASSLVAKAVCPSCHRNSRLLKRIVAECLVQNNQAIYKCVQQKGVPQDLYFSVHFYGYYDFVNSNDISKRYQSSTSKTVPSQIMAYKNRKSTLSHLLSSKGEIFSTSQMSGNWKEGSHEKMNNSTSGCYGYRTKNTTPNILTSEGEKF